MPLLAHTNKPRLSALASHPLARQMARGTLWSLTSNGVGQAFSLLGSVVTARCLGAGDFGKLAIVIATVNVFAVIGSAGLGLAATKHVAQFRESDPQRTGRVIGMSSATAMFMGALVCAILVALAPWIAVKLLVAPTLVRELRISAVILFFGSVNAYQVGALAGFEAFRSTAVANLVRGLGGFPLLVVGAVYGGLTGAVIANGLMAALSCAAHGLMLRKRCHRHGIRISYDLQREDLRVLYRYCLPALIAGMSYIPAVWASNAALARAAGYVETGLFQAAFHWQTVSLFLAVGVGNVGFPMLAANLRSHRSYVRVLAGNFSLTTGLTVASALLVAVAAPYIARLYGPQFNNATTVIRIMSACGVLIAINISAGQIIWSLDAASAAMLFELFRGTLLVAASVLLAGRGASGLAWAHLITAAGMTITEVPFCLLRLRALNRENSRVASSLAVPVTN